MTPGQRVHSPGRMGYTAVKLRKTAKFPSWRLIVAYLPQMRSEVSCLTWGKQSAGLPEKSTRQSGLPEVIRLMKRDAR